MTSQKDQIQALVAEIDGILQKTSPRLPWVISGDVSQQRRVLERVRNFLTALQQRGADPNAAPFNAANLLGYDVHYAAGQGGAASMTMEQMLQVIMQDVAALRNSLLAPVQVELESLRQQRELMMQELRQLESQRQSMALPQAPSQQMVSEVVQALMSRLQEALPQQIAMTLRSLPPQALYGETIASNDPARAMRMQAIQAQSDELLMNLDSTVRLVLESLQRDVQAYQESLGQGIERMHSLGQQGEMMFSALVSHLAEQLGRGASSYLSATGQYVQPTEGTIAQTTGHPLSASVEPTVPSGSSAGAITNPSTPQSTSGFPYAGAELTANPFIPPTPTADSWFDESTGATPLDLDIGDLPPIDLSQVELPVLDPPINPPQSVPQTTAPAPTSPEAGIDSAGTIEDTTDIDAALQLLEQLSAQSSSRPTELEAAEAQIDQALGTPAANAEELDEFYESLFGEDVETPVSPLERPEQSARSTAAEKSDGFEADASQIASPSNMPPDTRTADDPTLGWELLDPDTAAGIQEAAADVTADFGAATSPDFGAEFSQTATADVYGFPGFELPLNEPPTTPPAEAEPATATDQISALTDLFDSATPDLALQSSSIDQPQVDPSLAAAAAPSFDMGALPEDRFTLASPEETLLPAQEELEQPVLENWLDEGALTRLQEDLSNLEAGTFSDRLSPSSELSTSGLGWEAPAEPPSTQFQPAEPPAAELPVPPLEPAASIEPAPVEAPIEAPNFQETLADFLSDIAPASFAEPSLPTDGEPPLPNSTTDDAIGLSLTTFADALEPQTPPFPESFSEGQDFASAAPSAPVADTTSAFALEGAFTLEGMDDLFADTPADSALPDASVPPVEAIVPTPIEPPAFTLEGMDDLFADVPSVSATPVPPPAQPASTGYDSPLLGDMLDDLFDEASPIAAPSVPAVGESLANPLPTVEDLFEDEPFAPSTALESGVETLPTDSSPLIDESLVSFPIAGVGESASTMGSSVSDQQDWSASPAPADTAIRIDNLFEEPSTPSVSSSQSEFTSVENLFGDPPPPPGPTVEPGQEFTTVDNLFEQTPAAEPGPASPATEFVSVDNLFGDVPVAPPESPYSSADFTTSDFGSVSAYPPESSPSDSVTADNLFEDAAPAVDRASTPDPLQGMDDLFADFSPSSPTPPSPATGELVDTPDNVFSDFPPSRSDGVTQGNEWTLEGISSFFDDVPATPTTPPPTAAFTLTEIDGVYTEVPAQPPTAGGSTPGNSSASFVMDEVEGLFMEILLGDPEPDHPEKKTEWI